MLPTSGEHSSFSLPLIHLALEREGRRGTELEDDADAVVTLLRPFSLSPGAVPGRRDTLRNIHRTRDDSRHPHRSNVIGQIS